MNSKPFLPTALAASLLLAVSDAQASLNALWRFEITGITQVDATTNNNTATSVNGAAQVFDGTRGSGTMSFDGADDFLQVADSASISITGDMTIALWLNVTSVGAAGQWRGLLNKSPVGSTTPGPYQFWLNQGNLVPAFGRGDGTSNDFAFGVASISTGVWQHFAVTMSGTTVTMYLNGIPISMTDSLVNTTIADQNGPLIIGDRPGAQDMSFLGRMDDVAVFDQSLSQSQIQTIMTGDFTAFGVPEPGSAALVGLGAVLLAARRRRS